MQPFQEFRFWARRAPLGQRVATAVATLVAVSLLAWLVIPDNDAPSTEEVVSAGSNAPVGEAAAASDPSAAGGSTAEATVPGASAAARGATGAAGATRGGARAGNAGSTPGTGSGASPVARAAAPGCVPGTAKGITASEVRIVIALTEIIGPAANALFDIPTPAQARADFDAAIGGINKEGGVACRKLVARYINVNPTNESGMLQVCRDVASGNDFAIVDTGSLATRPAALACFGQRKVPYFGAYFITETARQQFYPYLYSFYTKEQLYKSTAFGLRDLGFFQAAKGFKKLGFIYRDCEREAINSFRRWIREAGVADANVVTYNVGCPAVFASETDLAQAVVTFRNEGVTHVTMGNLTGDIARFTAHAEQQRFRPKYGVPDEALLSVASGSRAPDPNNIANALGVALGREAEQQTPGMTPTPGTQKCNAYRKVAGLPPVYEVPANAGHACDQLWMLQAALTNATQLVPTGLPAGLQRVKAIDFSFPQGPSDFTAAKVTTGGQFWRVAQFMPGCRCWQVIQREFRRGF